MVPMAKDNQIAVRMKDPTYEAVREFSEEHDLTNAEAIRRMIEDRLAGEGYLSGSGRVDFSGRRALAPAERERRRLCDRRRRQQQRTVTATLGRTGRRRLLPPAAFYKRYQLTAIGGRVDNVAERRHERVGTALGSTGRIRPTGDEVVAVGPDDDQCLDRQ